MNHLVAVSGAQRAGLIWLMVEKEGERKGEFFHSGGIFTFTRVSRVRLSTNSKFRHGRAPATLYVLRTLPLHWLEISRFYAMGAFPFNKEGGLSFVKKVDPSHGDAATGAALAHLLMLQRGGCRS